jgi:hypothetical protein
MTIERTLTPKNTVAFETVTPDTARLWLSSRPYKGQRSLRPNHVKFLAEEMERGKFRSTAEVVFAVEDGHRHFIINGQHTLNAIALCGIPQMVIVVCHHSSGPEETASMYGAIDTNVPRTVGDYFSAIGLKDEVGLNPTQLNAVGGACKFIYNKFTGRQQDRMHHEDYRSMIEQYAPSAHQYFDMAIGAPGEIYNPAKRSATLSVALVTLRFSAQTIGLDKVSDFWRGVLFDDGLASGDPRKTANRHILTTGMRKESMKKHHASPQWSARYIANCFNAYIEKRTLKMTMIADSSSPIKILGSPFTGKE